MKTILKLFVAGILSATVPSPALAEAVAARILNDVGGTVHIHQQMPCGDPVKVDTSVAQGRMEITPRMTRDGLTAAVGSTRTQPRCGSHTSAQAWASIRRSTQ